MGMKEATDFNQIIHADRERKKNEALANEIFGAGRRSSAPGFSNGPRKAPQTPSLASRIGGISKPSQRASSTSGVRPNRPLTGSAPAVKGPIRPSSITAQQARSNKLENVLSSESASGQVNVIPQHPSSRGLTIRGTAGPFVVQASNFQVGTTAADIQNVLVDIAGPGATKACRIVTNHPTVVAEMVFEEKATADTVVKALNGEKADGRTLRCYLKMGPPPSGFPSAPLPSRQDSMIGETPSPAVAAVEANGADTEMMETTDVGSSTLPPQGASPFDDRRPASDHDKRDGRQAEPDVQDGRFGFEARHERQHYKPQRRQAQEELERNSRQNEDAREANRRVDRDRERDSERDSEQDRPPAYSGTNYPRPLNDNYRRDDGRYRGNGYRRDERPHYGNDIASRGRGYDDRGRYGRMYSDSMVSDRRGPPRGYR